MIAAIVVAAGFGTRLGAEVPKALVEVGGAPLLAWSMRAIDACDRITEIVVAAPAGHEAAIRDAVPPQVATSWSVVAGGASRQRSVAAALAAVPAGASAVLVHDAARPLVTADLFDRVIDALVGVDGAIAASPVADTLKRADAAGVVAETVDRAGLWRAETPQGFEASVLRAAFAAAGEEELDTATDCASMVERRGGRIRLVDARTPNLKLTTAADAAIVDALLAARGT